MRRLTIVLLALSLGSQAGSAQADAPAPPPLPSVARACLSVNTYSSSLQDLYDDHPSRRRCHEVASDPGRYRDPDPAPRPHRPAALIVGGAAAPPPHRLKGVETLSDLVALDRWLHARPAR